MSVTLIVERYIVPNVFASRQSNTAKVSPPPQPDESCELLARVSENLRRCMYVSVTYQHSGSADLPPVTTGLMHKQERHAKPQMHLLHLLPTTTAPTQDHSASI